MVRTLLLLLSVMVGVVVAQPSHAADTEAGKTLYQRNCSACHGKDGAGNGAAARALKPPPTSFKSAAYWESKNDEAIKAAIRTGRPGTSMMGFDTLTAEQLDNVVAYLRTFAPSK